MKVVKTNYGNFKEILKFADHYVGVAVMVDPEGMAANADGKKIVSAGTIVGGKAAPTLTDDTQPVVEKNDAGAEGVLLREVDVTHGSAPGTMIIHGFIDPGKLPEAPSAAAVTALKQITFLM